MRLVSDRTSAIRDMRWRPAVLSTSHRAVTRIGNHCHRAARYACWSSQRRWKVTNRISMDPTRIAGPIDTDDYQQQTLVELGSKTRTGGDVAIVRSESARTFLPRRRRAELHRHRDLRGAQAGEVAAPAGANAWGGGDRSRLLLPNVSA